MGVFDEYRDEVWPFVYDVEIKVKDLHGGRPQDPRVVEGWIKSKLQDNDERLRQLVSEAIQDLGYTEEDLEDPKKIEKAISQAGKKSLNGFYRLPAKNKLVVDGDAEEGELAVEGRQIKAMIKESTNIAFPWNKGQGEKYMGKSMKGAVSEHVFVLEDYVPLGTTEPDGIDVRFSATTTGRRAITREEFLSEVVVPFTMVTDMDLGKETWAQIFVTAELQGFGASRSQGYGTFETIKFDLRDS